MPEPTKLSVLTSESGDVSKPVTALMTKVSHVVGVLPIPALRKREAPPQAENGADLDKGKDQANDVQRRAWMRFVQEQAIHQINMEAIMARAVAEVKESADPEAVDEDWIAQFFGKCRTVSNEVMRTLWAKVLAGEVNVPGAFSKRALNVLGEMDRRDVEAFTQLCSFSIYSLGSPVIFYKSSQVAASYNPGLYLKHGLDLGQLQNLETIGLIDFDLKAEYTKPAGPIRYFGKTIAVKPEGQLKVGNAAFTKPGWELARIMTPHEIPEFFEYLQRVWQGAIAEGAAAAVAAPRLK